MVLLKYLSIFWRTLKRPLINCSKSSANIYNKWYKTFYISVITLSTQDNVKLLKQLESGFKRTINWNKYHSQKIFLSFKYENCQESYKQYYLPTV